MLSRLRNNDCNYEHSHITQEEYMLRKAQGFKASLFLEPRVSHNWLKIRQVYKWKWTVFKVSVGGRVFVYQINFP